MDGKIKHKETLIPVFHVLQIKDSGDIIGREGVIDWGYMLLTEVRKRKPKILETVSTIEGYMENIIVHFFFEERSSKSQLFTELILQSDFQFSAKKKLVNYIVRSSGILSKKDAGDFDKLIGDAMKYRNAFTHGRLSIKDGLVWLSYFEGKPQIKEVNNDFLGKVNEALSGAYNQSAFVLSEMKKTGKEK